MKAAKDKTDAIARRFNASVNMTPAAIRAWVKSPQAKCASFAATRARLPALAALKAKPASKWTAKDVAFAKRVLSFNARMSGVVKKHGCTPKSVISLRNWGRKVPGCRVPASCRVKRS